MTMLRSWGPTLQCRPSTQPLSRPQNDKISMKRTSTATGTKSSTSMSGLKLSNPDYYKMGVIELSEDQLVDKDTFWWKNKFNLIYEGLNIGMVKAFLAFKKQKENGKCSSHIQLRKYNDAILWGAKRSQHRLPLSYYEAMENTWWHSRKRQRYQKRTECWMSRRPTQSCGRSFKKYCSGLLIERISTCGYSPFHNGIAWLIQSTLASWLCIASALAKIAWLCAMIDPGRTRQEKRLATSMSMTIHLIHWFWVFLPWGFGSLFIRSLCFKGTKTKTMLLHKATVHSCPSFSKPSATSWYTLSKPTMPTLMEFEKEV
jgi:hypothetical protein